MNPTNTEFFYNASSPETIIANSKFRTKFKNVVPFSTIRYSSKLQALFGIKIQPSFDISIKDLKHTRFVSFDYEKYCNHKHSNIDPEYKIEFKNFLPFSVAMEAPRISEPYFGYSVHRQHLSFDLASDDLRNTKYVGFDYEKYCNQKITKN